MIISPIGALSFVQGGLNGILDGAGMATLVTAAPEGSIGAATALYFVSYTGAQALGNAAAGVFVTKYGFASMGTVMAAGSVPLLLFAMAVLPSGRVADNAAPAPRETAGAVASDSGGGKQSSSSYWMSSVPASTQSPRRCIGIPCCFECLLIDGSLAH